MNLVVIFGPLAVGKMTVGQKLCEATGFKLLHNHMTIDPLLPIFEFGSDALGTLVTEFRFRIVEEAAKSGMAGLVYTFVWDFNGPDDTDFIRRVMKTVEPYGTRICFVELQASLDVRNVRALTENRKIHKPGNVEKVERDVQHIANFESGYKLRSNGDFPFPESHLLIENDGLSAQETAAMIRKHFGI
jgi:hypothetical protein